MLVMITGLPGTGKTTFAGALAGKIKAVHLNSDMVRADMGKRGKYDAATKAEVYRNLQQRATRSLRKGDHVIVDATFYKSSYRQPYLEAGKELNIPVKWIELTADEEVIRERTKKKRAYSEANFEVYKKIKADAEPLDFTHLTLRSDLLSVDEMVERAIEYLRLGNEN